MTAVATILWLVGATSYGLRVAVWVAHPGREVQFMAGVAIAVAAFFLWVMLAVTETIVSIHRLWCRLTEPTVIW